MPELRHASLYERIYAVVRLIPYGRIVTYGQVAAVVGGKCRARTVGYALAALSPNSDLPWQRVINRQGKISPRQHGGLGSAYQRELLELEGVQFNPKTHRTDFKQFGWGGPDWGWLEEHGFYPMPILEN